MKPHHKYLLFLYLLLWTSSQIQSLIVTSSFWSLLFYIPFTFLTLIFTYNAVTIMPKRGAIWYLFVFFIVMAIYGIALLLLNDAKDQERTSFLMTVIGSIGPVFAFYYLTQRNAISYRILPVCFFLFLIIAILGFYHNRIEVLATTESRFDEITNNLSYGVLGLFPFIFVLKKRLLIQYCALAIISFFVITGMKRGAILILLILISFFIISSIKFSSKRKKWSRIVLIVIAIVIGIHFVKRYYDESEYFQYRVERTQEGASSQRDIVYSTLWHHFINNNSLIQIIFGEGAFHTVNVTGKLKAHNDWLELLIDCGLLGVVLFLVFWVSFFRDCLKCKDNPILFSILMSCFLFTFIRTLFSMSFTDIPFSLSMMMGYGLALHKSPIQLVLE